MAYHFKNSEREIFFSDSETGDDDDDGVALNVRVASVTSKACVELRKAKNEASPSTDLVAGDEDLVDSFNTYHLTSQTLRGARHPSSVLMPELPKPAKALEEYDEDGASQPDYKLSSTVAEMKRKEIEFEIREAVLAKKEKELWVAVKSLEQSLRTALQEFTGLGDSLSKIQLPSPIEKPVQAQAELQYKNELEGEVKTQSQMNMGMSDEHL